MRYDPKTGRFNSQDKYLGEKQNPPSYHRYLYAYGNPTVYVDPTGNYSLPAHMKMTVDVAMDKDFIKYYPKNKLFSFESERAKFARGMKRGVQYPDMPEGVAGMWKVFNLDKTIEKNAPRDSLTYKSHVGEKQYWHGMVYDEKDPVKFQKKLINRVVRLTKESRSAKSNYETAGFILGKAAHTIEDTYSKSHVVRNFDMEIIQFQDYTSQDHDKHSEADSDKKYHEHAKESIKGIIKYTLQEDFNEKEYKEYLRNKVFPLKGQDEGNVQTEMGGTHMKYEHEDDEE